MQLHKLSPQILLFTSEKNKELSLTFCRVQEFYESQNEKLLGKPFSFSDFIAESMDEDGFIDYFSYWTGFNFPDTAFREWYKCNNAFTDWEKDLIKQIQENVHHYDDKFYVIGALAKEKDTINHEIAHALYYLNNSYFIEMTELILEFAIQHKKQYNKMKKALIGMGYNENVLADEIQAYLSTSKKSELVEDFKLDYDTLSPLIKQFRKVLRKYNSFQI